MDYECKRHMRVPDMALVFKRACLKVRPVLLALAAASLAKICSVRLYSSGRHSGRSAMDWIGRDIGCVAIGVTRTAIKK